jgi:hypothetical protein
MGDREMLSEHVHYLREKAAQFRRVAASYPPKLARQLLALADEFDTKASELEAGKPRDPSPD